MMTDSKLLLLVTQKTELVELISFLAFFFITVPAFGIYEDSDAWKGKNVWKIAGLFLDDGSDLYCELYDRPDPCDCGDRGRAFLYGSHDYPCIVLWRLSYQRA